jgi:hypothetical protein
VPEKSWRWFMGVMAGVGACAFEALCDSEFPGDLPAEFEARSLTFVQVVQDPKTKKVMSSLNPWLFQDAVMRDKMTIQKSQLCFLTRPRPEMAAQVNEMWNPKAIEIANGGRLDQILQQRQRNGVQ